MSKFTSAMNAAVHAARDRNNQVAESLAPQVQAVAPQVQAVAPQIQTVAPYVQTVAPYIQAVVASPPRAEPAPVRRGRPAGKRSNHESVQVTAYIQAETHYATKIALLTNSRRGGPKKDFSDLVQELLSKWLQFQQ